MSALRAQVEDFLDYLKQRRDQSATMGKRLFLDAKVEEGEKILSRYFGPKIEKARRTYRIPLC